jgi:hypothetical protein
VVSNYVGFVDMPGNPEDDTMMKKHCAKAFYSAVKSLMHVIQTKDDNVQQDGVHPIIQIVKPWIIRR